MQILIGSETGPYAHDFVLKEKNNFPEKNLCTKIFEGVSEPHQTPLGYTHDSEIPQLLSLSLDKFVFSKDYRL